MVAAALVALPVLFSGRRIDRWEGAILALYYVGYVTYLVLTATGNGAAQSFGRAMVGFAVPLTLLTIGVIAYREWQSARA
jgi:cation:H+ antiporter